MYTCVTFSRIKKIIIKIITDKTLIIKILKRLCMQSISFLDIQANSYKVQPKVKDIYNNKTNTADPAN